MQIQILAVGKIKENYLQEALQEYEKRLRAYARVNILEIKDEKVAPSVTAAQRAEILAKEAARLDALINPQTYLIVLDIEGKQFSSVEFARHLSRLSLSGKSHVTFVIGGSLGLAKRIKDKADLRLSFSRLTFPHQLFRVMLLEQLYRAFKINRGEP
ncbi:MAG: 23S rRNA (pseudouridine(1915)-N(3))-methyltransferase RlmH, partial [Firmicutes bacterium]|nr:23S rRNA (pseudouridine(1915)-N(3))-methyltransferase RlmH [Bacillota bacterium]